MILRRYERDENGNKQLKAVEVVLTPSTTSKKPKVKK